MKSCWITILTIAIMMLGVANHSAAQDSRFKKVEQEVPTKKQKSPRQTPRRQKRSVGIHFNFHFN